MREDTILERARVTSLTDVELMTRVRDGDIGQLTHLFKRHHLRLYNFYLRLTNEREASEDLVQEVFFRILKYRHTFRGDGEFVAWMYHLARNALFDQMKKRNTHPAANDGHEEMAASDPIAQEQLEVKQEHELLQEALARLPIEKKELLIMSRYQDLRYEVIAQILGCSVEAVKVRVHRAMLDLRTIFFQLSGEKGQ